MSTTGALKQIFEKLTGTTKWQLDFFYEINDSTALKKAMELYKIN